MIPFRRRAAAGFVPFVTSIIAQGSAGTMLVPAGATGLTVEGVGGGPGGGAKTTGFAKGGGGAGYFLEVFALDPADPGKLLPYVIGGNGDGAPGGFNGAGSPATGTILDTTLLVAGVGVLTANPGTPGSATVAGTGGTATGAGTGPRTSGANGTVNGGNSGSGAIGGQALGGDGSSYGAGGAGGGRDLAEGLDISGGVGGLAVLVFHWS